MINIFEKEAKRLIEENNVEEVRRALVSQMDKAGLEYLSDGKDRIFELFESVRENFDGTEYMQGKKDGLRTALALLGNVGMSSFNRGESNAREKQETMDGG